MDDNQGVVWINTEIMQERMHSMSSMTARGLAVIVFMHFTAGGRHAFTFDPEAIARAASNKAQTVTAAEVLSHRADLQKLFVVLPDGRWAASPEIFSVTDPMGEGAAS